MNTIKIICFIVLSVSTWGCKKEVPFDKVIWDFTVDKQQVTADGNSSVTLSVKLNNKSSSDRRNIIFSTNNGSFGEGGKKTVKAEFLDGVLTAKATFKVSTEPGEIIVSAQPDFDARNQEFRIFQKVTAVPSIAKSVKLEPSSFGIGSNFLNEVALVGVIKNENGSFVSSGQKVVFEDFLISGSSASGRFRDLHILTTDSSMVNAIYSAPSLPLGTNIIIRCTLLDNSGIKTNIKDEITLTINQ